MEGGLSGLRELWVPHAGEEEGKGKNRMSDERTPAPGPARPAGPREGEEVTFRRS